MISATKAVTNIIAAAVTATNIIVVAIAAPENANYTNTRNSGSATNVVTAQCLCKFPPAQKLLATTGAAIAAPKKTSRSAQQLR